MFPPPARARISRIHDPQRTPNQRKYLLQYFDCLPTKLDTWCCHSIWKMISASRRIFWDGFQRFLKKVRFSASVFSIASHLFSNQNKLWNMLQAAFDHEKSFFDTPKGWKPLSQWVFDVIDFAIIQFCKKWQNWNFFKNYPSKAP